MTDYTALTDAQLSLDEPFTFEEARALRDNPIAIAEGSSGAPKIQNAAFSDGTIGAEKLQSGTDEHDWVLSRIGFSGISAAYLANTTTERDWINNRIDQNVFYDGSVVIRQIIGPSENSGTNYTESVVCRSSGTLRIAGEFIWDDQASNQQFSIQKNGTNVYTDGTDGTFSTTVSVSKGDLIRGRIYVPDPTSQGYTGRIVYIDFRSNSTDHIGLVV